MEITNKNIEKDLDYLDKLDNDKFDSIINKYLDEQAYLSTFFQQNIDNLFNENSPIIDFSFNIYFNVLFLFKSKLGKKYYIISENTLKKILSDNNKEHKQENLGDFIYAQFASQDFEKEDILKAVRLLNIIILSLDN